MFDAEMKSAYATEITQESLEALINNEILAIRMRNFVSPDAIYAATRVIKHQTANSTYTWSKDFGVIGVSVGEAHESAEKEQEYFERAPETDRLIQSIFSGGSPIATISRSIACSWAHGLQVARKDGQMFLPEIIRHWRTGGGANPHIDQTRTPLLAHLDLKKRLGCNVYMDMPTEGGAIEFWGHRFTDEEYEAAKRSDYGLDRDVLGDPGLKIRPCAPEAILFDASLPHAVEEAKGEGDRIVNASFFAFSDFDKPLVQFA